MSQPRPDPKLIDSMCLRFDHAFFAPRPNPGEDPIGLCQSYTEEERDVLRSQMRQVWEEVVGIGFYKYSEGKTPSFP